MGDYGNLYATYTKETCEEMKKLVSYANILTPNLTEACILTGREYNAESVSYTHLDVYKRQE